MTSGSFPIPILDARFTDPAPIASGAMGTIYRVFDTVRTQHVAVKTLQALLPDEIFWLKNEFRALRDLRHRNLVELHDLWVTPATCYFTMELVDGIDFVSFVARRRESPEAEVLGALDHLGDLPEQLVLGIQAVHAAGKLHRDIKPSNVLVTPDGRVVVLDFGLVLPMRRAADPSERGVLTGTLLYMPPEQARGAVLDAKADWYSFGVVLFEALAGEPPYAGTPSDVFAQKQRKPRDVREPCPTIPEPIALLVGALLDPDPALRPEGDEILSVLRASATTRTTSTDGVRFVGRAVEIDRLEQIYAEAGTTPVVAHVRGPSGIGKSSLLEHFVATLERREEVLVLRGLCHPRESVPYKALDGVIDDLTQQLLDEPRDRAILADAGAGPLQRLFPVLARVDVALDGDADDAPSDPVEARRAGATALARVLAEIARRRRLVIWIDDLQWGDSDSAALLRSVMAAASLPSFLLLLSYRSEDLGSSPLLAEIAAEPLEGPRARRFDVPLAPLSASEAMELASTLASAHHATHSAAEIARDAGGSPFFIRELARYRGPIEHTGAAGPRLEAILAERLTDLPELGRRILELVSLAATTLSTRTAATAADGGGDGFSAIRLLESEGFIRLSPLGGEHGVVPFHDRIREAVVAGMDATSLVARHGVLARVIQGGPDPDPEALLTHYLGCGDRAGAFVNAREAAGRAAHALAFGRAAELYRQAIELHDGQVPPSELLVERAGALANAGRSAEAAVDYAAAASALERTTSRHPSGHPSLLDLRRRSAEHHLRAGLVIEGVSALRDVLRDVGVPFAGTPARALVHAITERTRLAWRGHRFARRLEELPHEVRLRLDTLWGATVTLGIIDQVMADAIGIRHFREAFDRGDAVHAARAVGLETAKAAQIGGTYQRKRVARMLPLMERLVGDVGTPYEQAYYEIVSGACAYQSARWREASERCNAGNAILRRSCQGVSWELATSEAFVLSSLAYMGELQDVGERLPAAIRDADDRRDLYASVAFRAGVLNLVWLAQDDPAEARRQAEEAIARWPATGAFNVQHYLHLIASVHVDLYEGDCWAAWRRIEAAWPSARKALFLAMETPRVELRFLRARTALACARSTLPGSTAGPTPPDPRWPLARLLKVVDEDQSRIARVRGLPSATPIADLLRASRLHLGGQTEEARAAYALGRRAFERLEMGLYAAASAAAEGRLAGGDQGAQLIGDAHGWLTSRGVRAPQPMLALASPAS